MSKPVPVQVPGGVYLRELANANQITISDMKLKPDAESFTVQLYCPDGIAFRMVVESVLGGTTIAKCNSILNGHPTREEIHQLPCLQQVQGEKFEMTITAGGCDYIIQVQAPGNKPDRFTYKYIPKVNWLEFHGDLVVPVQVTAPQ